MESPITKALAWPYANVKELVDVSESAGHIESPAIIALLNGLRTSGQTAGFSPRDLTLSIAHSPFSPWVMLNIFIDSESIVLYSSVSQTRPLCIRPGFVPPRGAESQNLHRTLRGVGEDFSSLTKPTGRGGR